MIKALLSVRFRALLAGLTAQSRQKKKRGTGMMILFAFLFLYLGVVLLGMMSFLFFSLAEPYHATGLDWVYFSTAALIALGFSVLGSVFTTQSQLYDAKDNPLLLSMPIPPKYILLTRMVPLLALNLLYSAIVLLPATVIYGIVVRWSFALVAGQLLSLLSVTVLAQAIACLLGWLLHLLLSRMNKSAASMIYMILFLTVYFSVYSKANDILGGMITGGAELARTLPWIWPLYALGKGSAGQLLLTLGGLAVCSVCFALAYRILSATFLSYAMTQGVSRKQKKLDLSGSKAASPVNAIVRKELRKFLGTPVYLTNMGLGLVMTLALTVAGVWFRRDLMEMVSMVEGLEDFIPVLICATGASVASMTCISCPSVSLEGKNIWILKSLPITSRDILIAKLELHIRLTLPMMALAGLTLSAVYGCGIADILLCTLICCLLSLTTGLVGMNAGLKWAKLDYISEAYPCKQSVSVAVTMFGMMGLPLVFGLVYLFLLPFLSPTVFLAICAVVLTGVCFGLYRLMVTWGAKKWESLG